MAPDNPYRLAGIPRIPDTVAARLREDYDRQSPLVDNATLCDVISNRYEVDLRTEYGGMEIPNPFGKASGQLSMTARQVQEDVEAGLGFVVLKTVIAEDEGGDQSMKAWAVRESRMVAEPITGTRGDRGWTISWKGRGWWQSFEDYCQLVRDARDIAGATPTLIVPSCKYHLPTEDDEPWRTSEYRYSTQRLIEAWQPNGASMPIEKDFSPTLAGSDLARIQKTILDWLQSVPRMIRDGASGHNVIVGLKLFNALFDDEFQLRMLDTAHDSPSQRPDFYIYGNRLFDPDRMFDGHQGIAFGGPDLSDRNIRVMRRFQSRTVDDPLSWSATGNITTGRMALEYALCGASSFQMHTVFQLPADQYTLADGSRSQKVLHELLLHPESGLVAWMHHVAAAMGLDTRPVRLRDLVGVGRHYDEVVADRET